MKNQTDFQQNLNLFLSNKHIFLQESDLKRSVRWLMKTRLCAIKHLPDKENLIDLVWKRSLLLLFPIRYSVNTRNAVFYMLASLPKNKWTTLLDKLTSFNNGIVNEMNEIELTELKTLPLILLQILLLESISKGKDYRPFWTPVCQKISEQLLSLTVIDCPDSDLNSYSASLRKPVEMSSSLMITQTKVQNKNSPKIFYPLSKSLLAKKWENDDIQESKKKNKRKKKNKMKKDEDENGEKNFKSKRIRLLPTENQKKILKNWFDNCNYLYNKAVEEVEVRKHPVNFISLRDLLVTYSTRKSNDEYKNISDQLKQLDKEIKLVENEDEKNKLVIRKTNLKNQQNNLDTSINNRIKSWELETPKQIRSNAIADVVKAYKTSFENLKQGNIRFFKIKYRKKLDAPKSFVLEPQQISVTIQDDITYFTIMPQFFGKENCKFTIGKSDRKKLKDFKIDNNCRIIKENEDYFILVPIPITFVDRNEIFKTSSLTTKYSGKDPGLTTFMTSVSNENVKQYTHNVLLLKKLNHKIFLMKEFRKRKYGSTRVRKKAFNKLEKKKSNVVDEIHWKTINDIIKDNDVIFYGDIKSHDIVKNGKIKVINQRFNDLKFYKFKQRLLYKAKLHGKTVIEVNESNTTKCCSNCGTLSTPKNSKVYVCLKCEKKFERDENSGKNMMIKGILYLLSL